MAVLRRGDRRHRAAGDEGHARRRVCTTTAPIAIRSGRGTSSRRPARTPPVTVTVPNGPNGTVAQPVPTTATLYNLNSAFLGLQNNVVDNQPYLDTNYKGVEFSASKRMSHRWQMVAGFTFGKNTGGSTPTARPVGDDRPERSEQHPLLEGRRRPRLQGRVQAVRQLPVAVASLLIAGSLIANGGGPYVSTYSGVTRGGGAGRRADAREPDGVPQRARRRAAADA